MPRPTSGWRSHSSADPVDPEIQRKIAKAQQRVPIATVTLRIYSTKQGDSTAEVDMPDQGRFSPRPGAPVSEAYAVLANVCLRELRRGLGALSATAAEFGE